MSAHTLSHLPIRKAAWACLPALSLMVFSACNGEDVESINSVLDQATITNGIQCAFVLTDGNDTTANYATCPTGYQGYTCRSDSAYVNDGPTCNAASGNPVQSAIDYARSNNATVIRLDSGIFEYNAFQTGVWNNYKFGIWVPSNMWVAGESGSGSNISAVQPAANLINGGVVHDGVFLWAGDKADPPAGTALTGGAIQNIFIHAKSIAMWGIFAGRASGNLAVTNNSVVSPKGGGFQLGIVDSSRRSAPNAPDQLVGAFNGSGGFNNISNNQIYSPGGDALAVIGNSNAIQYNTITNDPNINNSGGGITLFVKSTSDLIYGNNIIGATVAISCDGSYLPYCPGCANFDLLSLNGGAGSSIGYQRYHTIQNNTINQTNVYPTYPIRGIELWRVSNLNVSFNTLIGPLADVYGTRESTGLAFNETASTFVYYNNISRYFRAINLISGGYGENDSSGNRIGTSYNSIGTDSTWQTLGNTICDNANPVKLERWNVGAIKGNVIRGNSCPYTSSTFYSTCSGVNMSSDTCRRVWSFDFTGSTVTGSNPASNPDGQWCSSNMWIANWYPDSNLSNYWSASSPYYGYQLCQGE